MGLMSHMPFTILGGVQTPLPLDSKQPLPLLLCIFTETIYYDPNLNCLDETVQMRGHNICF